jgi:hypothetical protein
VGPESSGESLLRVAAAPNLKPGMHLVALDVTLDGKRYGQWFDMIVCVEP